MSNDATQESGALQNWEVAVVGRGKTTTVEVKAKNKFEAKNKAEERGDVHRAKPGDDAVVPFERGPKGGHIYVSERDLDE